MLAIPDLTWSNLFPVEWNNTRQIMAGMIHSMYAFFGIEMYLLYRPFLKQDLQVKGKPLLIYQLVIFIFYFISVVFTQMFFALEEVQLIPEPIMYILKSQEVNFVKRLDIFFHLYLAFLVHCYGHDLRFVLSCALFVKKTEASETKYCFFFIFS